MSAIRNFDEVPHIVRYGAQDEDEGTSWTLFYRNATCFRVSVSHADIKDTPFAAKWLELNKEPKSIDEHKQWVNRWNDHCDCIITQCMPLLVQLAPSTRKWVTLEDHLRTPTYNLELVADKAAGDAVAEVTNGPIAKPSYEHHLIPFAEFEALPTDLPQYQAQDLIVLGPGKNWRQPPSKLQTPSGDVLYFVACHRRSKFMPSGEISNASLDQINLLSRLHATGSKTAKVHVPELVGIVVSSATPEGEDWDWDGTQRTATKPQSGDREAWVAGVLLPYLSKAKTLGDVNKLFKDKEGGSVPAQVMEKWKTQVTSAVQHLHDNGIAIGGRTDPDNPWFYINEYTVLVAPVENNMEEAKLADTNAWLTPTAACSMLPREGEQDVEAKEKFDKYRTVDLEVLTELFGK